MSRMRTHKKEFTIISNETIQACNLSLEAIGLLAICLSMPANWDFNPKQMWKKGYCGREKLYKIFNELIESGHCIRVRYPNDKFKNLPGDISYEIFDDVLECEKRCLELQKEIVLIECSEKFECSRKFKKRFQRPENRDTEIRDPESWDTYKETEKKKTLNKETYTESSSSKETSLFSDHVDDACGADDDLEKSSICEESIEFTRNNGQRFTVTQSEIYKHFLKKPYSTEILKEAINRIKLLSEDSFINSPLKYLEEICKSIVNDKNKPKNKEKKQKKEEPVVYEKLIKWNEFFKRKEEHKNV